MKLTILLLVIFLEGIYIQQKLGATLGQLLIIVVPIAILSYLLGRIDGKSNK